MTYVSPAAKAEAALPVKPISPKREFEQLIRSIRMIAANSRAFSGELIQQLIEQTKSSARNQKNWSLAGAGAQFSVTVAAVALGVKKNTDQNKLIDTVSQSFQIGAKVGDVAQAACGATQFGYQADSQKIQQSLAHYNTFDQRMQTLMSSIDSIQQRLQQKEMEEASNR